MAEFKAGRTIILTPGNEVDDESTHWLWEKRIPIGELTMLVGRGGSAKSQLLALLAAKVTNGTLPGEFFGLPRVVVYVYNEDNLNTTIKPRMEAAGVNHSLMRYVKVTNAEGATVGLSLPLDCDLLAAAAKEHDAAVIMYDPLSSSLSGRRNDGGEMRAVFEAIRKMHEENELAGVGLGHVRKAVSTNLIDAWAGSAEQANVVRSAWGVAVDDSKGEGVYVLSNEKNNLAPAAPSLEYRIDGHAYPNPRRPSEVIETSRVVILGETDTSVTQILSDQIEGGRGHAMRAACDFIREYLMSRGGEAMQRDVIRSGREEHNPRTLQRAAKRLGVLYVQHGAIGQQGSGTLWRLP
jgi:hypothetical protein